MRALLLSLLLVTPGPAARAHEDGAGEQLALLDERLSARPDAGDYLARAELLRRTGRTARAFEDLAAAAALAPREPGLWLLKARLLRDQRRLPEALERYERYLRLRPGDAPARREAARVAERLEAWPRALRHRDRLLADAPALDDAVARARVAARMSPREALESLEEHLARWPASAALRLERVELLVALGDPDAALAELARLAGAASERASWLGRMGDVCARCGRAERARDFYLRALRDLRSDTGPRARTPQRRALERELVRALERLDDARPAPETEEPPS